MTLFTFDDPAFDVRCAALTPIEDFPAHKHLLTIADEHSLSRYIDLSSTPFIVIHSAARGEAHRNSKCTDIPPVSAFPSMRAKEILLIFCSSKKKSAPINPVANVHEDGPAKVTSITHRSAHSPKNLEVSSTDALFWAKKYPAPSPPVIRDEEVAASVDGSSVSRFQCLAPRSGSTEVVERYNSGLVVETDRSSREYESSVVEVQLSPEMVESPNGAASRNPASHTTTSTAESANGQKTLFRRGIQRCLDASIPECRPAPSPPPITPPNRNGTGESLPLENAAKITLASSTTAVINLDGIPSPNTVKGLREKFEFGRRGSCRRAVANGAVKSHIRKYETKSNVSTKKATHNGPRSISRLDTSACPPYSGGKSNDDAIRVNAEAEASSRPPSETERTLKSTPSDHPPLTPATKIVAGIKKNQASVNVSDAKCGESSPKTMAGAANGTPTASPSPKPVENLGKMSSTCDKPSVGGIKVPNTSLQRFEPATPSVIIQTEGQESGASLTTTLRKVEVPSEKCGIELGRVVNEDPMILDARNASGRPVNAPPPPPPPLSSTKILSTSNGRPAMPPVTEASTHVKATSHNSTLNARDSLMEAIRNAGGVKSLRNPVNS